MAVSIATTAFVAGLRLIRDTDIDNTGEDNVLGGAATIYLVELDNTANGAASYAKFYNNADPTIGTTDPDIIIMVPASGSLTVFIPSGLAFPTALSFAGVTAGGTAGVTSPTSNMLGSIVASE